MQPIRKLLDQIIQSPNPDQAALAHAYRGFSEQEKASFSRRSLHPYAGKVRELIQSGEDLFIFHSDRLSAFDCFVGMVPYKGVMLAEISQFWLQAANHILPTHFLARPHERVLQCRRCKPFKVEVIVRGYMAGSMMRAYQKGLRNFCGETLAAGLENFRPLPHAIITPTSKAEVFEHDEDSSPDELIAQGVCTSADWEEIASLALKLFQFGQEKYEEKGWILVDTKYEFGRDAAGTIRVIDEIHTPDSSRLWVKSTYEQKLARGESPDMLDKEVVRRYLMDQGFSGQGPVPPIPIEKLIALAQIYLHVAETLSGKILMSSGPMSESPRVI